MFIAPFLGAIAQQNFDFQSIDPSLLQGKMEQKAADFRIELKQDYMLTSLIKEQQITGKIANFIKNKTCVLTAMIEGKKVLISLNAKGNFEITFPLKTGTNYFDLNLFVDGKVVHQQPVIIFFKEQSTGVAPELVMWLDQSPNSKVLIDDVAVEKMVSRVKKAGFTSISLDVKGPEGYVTYRKNDLSGTPYITATSNSNKKIADTGFDQLESVVEQAHRVGLKVYAAFNFFTEGNAMTQDYAILNEHKDWEEVVQRPEDRGKLYRLSESNRGREAAAGKVLALTFVNPSNKEVQDFQLLRVEEVLKNYDVDGVMLDRCRYDNIYADFSPVTRNAFDDYLVAEGKELINFPADAFRINQKGEMLKGQYYKEWITFRSYTLKKFTDRIRTLVNRYKEEKPHLKMAAYVGSWYEVYYQNGVNWASKSFQYDKRLGFPEDEIYGIDYNKTSYIDNLDFLMIGTYYKTEKEVNHYITLGNILTCGELPIIGSISLPDLKVDEPATVFKASMINSAGLMIFDYCHVKWDSFLNSMRIISKEKKY